MINMTSIGGDMWVALLSAFICVLISVLSYFLKRTLKSIGLSIAKLEKTMTSTQETATNTKSELAQHLSFHEGLGPLVSKELCGTVHNQLMNSITKLGDESRGAFAEVFRRLSEQEKTVASINSSVSALENTYEKMGGHDNGRHDS
jgi:hypothetical protein